MRRFGTIYKKEIVDTLRDRRTLAAMLLVPMVIYPLTLLVTTETIAAHQRAGKTRDVRALIEGEVPVPAIHALASTAGIRVQVATDPPAIRTASTSSAAELAAARQALSEDDFDVLIIGDRDAERSLDEGGTARLTLFYDATRDFADSGILRVEEALLGLADHLLDERMRALGAHPNAAHPLAITRRSVSTEAQLGGRIASTMLPTLILLFIALSSFYPAVDLTAGEKERKTLATLLTAPLHALDIVFGKYLAVVTVGSLAGLLNVLVLSFTLLRVIANAGERHAAAFEISAPAMIGLLLSVVLIALPVGALMLLTASLARSFRDASYLLTPVMMICIAPSVLCALPGFDLTPGFALIPLANAALLMKSLLLGKATLGAAAIVCASTLVATAVLLFFASRVFSDERVLFSSSGRRVDFKSLLVAPPPASISTALTFTGFAFAMNYYGAFLTLGEQPLRAIVLTQIAAHLLPALLLAAWMSKQIPVRDLLAIRLPRSRFAFAAILIGLGAWLGVALPMSWLTSSLIPGQEEFAKAFKAALDLDRIPLGVVLLTLAVLPAIAEEIAFRGVILGILERVMRPSSAIVVQALLFGAMHGSVFRFLPTAILGLLLGVLAFRSRSILPSVIAHGLNNAILVTIDRAPPGGIEDIVSEPSLYALVGLALVGVGLAVARPGGAPKPQRV